jgi:hypothetical protein
MTTSCHRTAIWRTFCLLGLALLAGCASSGGPPRPDGERDLVAAEQQQAHEVAALEAASAGDRPPDCPRAASLRDAICTLADRICALIGRDRSIVEGPARCEQARLRCQQARARVDARCPDRR